MTGFRKRREAQRGGDRDLIRPGWRNDYALGSGRPNALLSGGSKGAKRRKKHAERAEEVQVLADCLAVFEDALIFDKFTQVAAKKKTSGCASEDVTCPSRSPDSELGSVIDAVQQRLRAAAARNPKKSGGLANKVCVILKGDASPVKCTLASPRRSERMSSSSVGNMDTGGTSKDSIRTATSGRKSTSKALSASLEDTGICNMRDRIVAKKKKVAEEANKQLSMKKNAPKTTKKAEADEEGRQLTKLPDRALEDFVGDVGGMADTANSRVHRLLTFDTGGLFSIAWCAWCHEHDACTCQGSGLRSRLGSAGKICRFF